MAAAQGDADAAREYGSLLAAAEKQRDALFKDKARLEGRVKELQARVKKQEALVAAVGSGGGGGGGGGGAPATISSTVKVVFRKYDKDRSGSIDTAELRTVGAYLRKRGGGVRGWLPARVWTVQCCSECGG